MTTKPAKETETKPEFVVTFRCPATGDFMQDAQIILDMDAEMKALGEKFAKRHGTWSAGVVNRRAEKKSAPVSGDPTPTTIPAAPIPGTVPHRARPASGQEAA